MRARYTTVTKDDLVAIGRGCIFHAKILGHELPPDFERSLTRICRRSKELLYKWFVDNWAVLQHVIPYVHLADEHKNLIGRSVATPAGPLELPRQHPSPSTRRRQ
jgi:hypothetical protein